MGGPIAKRFFQIVDGLTGRLEHVLDVVAAWVVTLSICASALRKYEHTPAGLGPECPIARCQDASACAAKRTVQVAVPYVGVVDRRAQIPRLNDRGHALTSALGQCHFGASVAITDTRSGFAVVSL